MNSLTALYFLISRWCSSLRYTTPHQYEHYIYGCLFFVTSQKRWLFCFAFQNGSSFTKRPVGCGQPISHFNASSKFEKSLKKLYFDPTLITGLGMGQINTALGQITGCGKFLPNILFSTHFLWIVYFKPSFSTMSAINRQEHSFYKNVPTGCLDNFCSKLTINLKKQ